MLKKTAILTILGGVALLPLQAALADPIQSPVIDTAGKQIGTVRLEQTPNGVLISADVKGLPEGEHGFHIHQKGICDPAEGFKTSGGHFAPAGHAHGYMDPSGPHAGDMPNQYAGSDGVLRAEVINPAVTLGEGANSLIDADGSALVIHAGADDYTTQPTGNAGGRLACAVISPPKSM